MNNLTIEQIVEMANEEMKSYEEHELSADSGYAEFCMSFGYGDTDKDEVLKYLGEALEGEHCDAYGDYLKSLDSNDLFNLLGKHIELSIGDIWNETYQVFSVIVGEIEYQFSDELVEAIEGLNEEEWLVFNNDTEFFYKEGYGYTDCSYDVMRAILDTESLVAELRTLDTKVYPKLTSV